MRVWRGRRRQVDGDGITAEEWMHRGADLLSSDLDAAEQCYLRALALDDTLADGWFDLGLVAKWRERWADCLAHNRRAASLTSGDPAGNPAFWNAGIAATALRDWDAARWAWRSFGIPIAEGDGPIDENFGPGVVRLPDGETVWGTRIDPARMRLLSIPLPAGGFRCDDIVLHDGEPVGSRVANGHEFSVFNVIDRWQASGLPTIEVEVVAGDHEVGDLVDAATELGLAVENWTESIAIHCAACSSGRVDYDDPEHDHRQVRAPDAPVRLGFAAEESAVRSVLGAWANRSGGQVLGIVVHA